MYKYKSDLWNSGGRSGYSYASDVWLSPLTGERTVAPMNSGLLADYYTDGVADDVQIQSAVTAMSAAGGVVKLMKGTYNLSGAITISSSNITIEGEGHATKLFVSNSANILAAIVLSGTGVLNVKVRNLMIDCNKANQSSGDGIYVDTPWQNGSFDPNHVFQDVYILNPKNNGFEVEASSDTRVLHLDRVRVRGADGNGFYFPAPSSTDNIIRGCIAEVCALNGFYYGGLNSHLSQCKAFYCGSAGGNNHGFYISGYNNYLVSCEAQDNYQSGLYSQNDGDATHGTKDNVLIGFIGDSNGQNGGSTYACGVQLKDCTNWQIIGGLFQTRPYNDFTQRIGISLEGTTTGTKILGAQGTGNSTALYVDSSTGINTFGDHRASTFTIAPRGSKYGADFFTDGTGDEVQLEAAVAAITNSGEEIGGKILLMPGTYTLAHTFDIAKQGITLEGMGEETSYILMAGGVSEDTIKIGDSSSATNGKNITLKNIKVAANTGQTAIYVDKVQRLKLEDIVVRFGTNGIHLEDWQWISLKNIAMRNIKGIGLDIVTNTNSEGHASFRDIDISLNSTDLGNGANGISITRSGSGEPIYETIFDRCHVITTDDTATGVILLKLGGTTQVGRGLTFQNCTFEALNPATTDLIAAQSNGANVVMFQGCTWFGGGRMAKGFDMPNDNGAYTFMNCHMNNFLASTGIGIDAGGSSDNIFLHQFTTSSVATAIDGTVKTFSTA